MAESTLQLRDYYANLLILQYIGKIRAYATIQTQVTPVIMPQTSVQQITFSPIPDSGQFVLSYGGSFIDPINWDDDDAEIEAKIRGIAPDVVDGGTASTPSFGNDVDGGDANTTIVVEDLDGGDAFGFGFTGITVTGSIASGTLIITFDGLTPPADLLVLESNTLMSGSDPVTITITETDQILPLAVQDGFNLFGSNIAVGKQLDVIGKYVGVSRTGNGFTTQITLDDAGFLTLIQLAIIRNNQGSSLATIQDLLHQFFPNQLMVADYQDMFLAYSISDGIAPSDVLQLMITEGLLPRPMGVGEIITVFDATNAFGFEDSVDSGGFGDLSDASVGGEFASLFSPP